MVPIDWDHVCRELERARAVIDRMIGARLLTPFDPGEDARFRDWTDYEDRLLAAVRAGPRILPAEVDIRGSSR